MKNIFFLLLILWLDFKYINKKTVKKTHSPTPLVFPFVYLPFNLVSQIDHDEYEKDGEYYGYDDVIVDLIAWRVDELFFDESDGYASVCDDNLAIFDHEFYCVVKTKQKELNDKRLDESWMSNQ